MEHEYMRTHYGEKYWDKLCGKPMPEESTPPIWKENYLLQQQYIEELERELNAANAKIKRLESVENSHADVLKAIDNWMQQHKSKEAKP